MPKQKKKEKGSPKAPSSTMSTKSQNPKSQKKNSKKKPQSKKSKIIDSSKNIGNKVKTAVKNAVTKKLSRKRFNFIPFLKKLVKIKKSSSKPKTNPLLYENREVLFGGLAEPITRGRISEPYDAGKYQGPVLYGVGTNTSGPTSPPNNCPVLGTDYSSYVDNIVWNVGGNARVIHEVTGIYSTANPLDKLSNWASASIIGAITTAAATATASTAATAATATAGTGAGMGGGGNKQEHRGGAYAAVAPARDHSNARIPRCWAIGIPLVFGQGKSKFDPTGASAIVWDWGEGGGGTGHEMEHAIKCITQAMLNFLSQKPGVGDSAMHNILYEFFYNILKGLKVGNGEAEIRAKEISRKITMMLRKQQVAAGLPSCALFNQFKCAVDLIKIELNPIPGTGWFYVNVRPDKEKIAIVVHKMRRKKAQSGKMNEKGEYVEKGGCNFYGMDMEDDKKPRSVWNNIDRLKRCYSQEGAKGQGSVRSLLDGTQYEADVNYTYNLKNISEYDLVNLIVGRTSIVCGIYNQILNCVGNNSRGQKLSGIIIASSLLMLSINMRKVLEEDQDLETSSEPQLYELGGRAASFLTNLLLNSGELEDLLTNYENSGDYTRFMSLITNETTRKYLEEAGSVGQLFVQGGGSLPVEPLDEPESPRYPGDLGDPFSLKAVGTGMSRPTTPQNTQQGHLSKRLPVFAAEEEMGEEEEVELNQSDIYSLIQLTRVGGPEDAIQLFSEVDSLLNQKYSGEGERVFCGIVNNQLDDELTIMMNSVDDLLKNPFDSELNDFIKLVDTSLEMSQIEDEEELLKIRNKSMNLIWQVVLGGVVDEPQPEDMDAELQPEDEEGNIMDRPTTTGWMDAFLGNGLPGDLSLFDSDSDSDDMGEAEMAQKKKRKKKKHQTRKKPSQKKKRRRKRTRKKENSLYQKLLKRLGY